MAARGAPTPAVAERRDSDPLRRGYGSAALAVIIVVVNLMLRADLHPRRFFCTTSPPLALSTLRLTIPMPIRAVLIVAEVAALLREERRWHRHCLGGWDGRSATTTTATRNFTTRQQVSRLPVASCRGTWSPLAPLPRLHHCAGPATHSEIRTWCTASQGTPPTVD